MKCKIASQMLNPLNKSWVERNIMVLTKPDTITKFNSISPNQSFACMYIPPDIHWAINMVKRIDKLSWSFRWRLSLHSNIIFACDCFVLEFPPPNYIFTDIHIQLPWICGLSFVILWVSKSVCSSSDRQFDKRKIAIWAFETRVSSSSLSLAQVAK